MCGNPLPAKVLSGLFPEQDREIGDIILPQ
jgi:hypothetical protein